MLFWFREVPKVAPFTPVAYCSTYPSPRASSEQQQQPTTNPRQVLLLSASSKSFPRRFQASFICLWYNTCFASYCTIRPRNAQFPEQLRLCIRIHPPPHTPEKHPYTSAFICQTLNPFPPSAAAVTVRATTQWCYCPCKLGEGHQNIFLEACAAPGEPEQDHTATRRQVRRQVANQDTDILSPSHHTFISICSHEPAHGEFWQAAGNCRMHRLQKHGSCWSMISSMTRLTCRMCPAFAARPNDSIGKCCQRPELHETVLLESHFWVSYHRTVVGKAPAFDGELGAEDHF